MNTTFCPLDRHAETRVRRRFTGNTFSSACSSISGISLASVGQLIGVSSLGYLFIDGLQRSFPTEIYVGLVLIIVLALACDLILVAFRRAVTPWAVRT